MSAHCYQHSVGSSWHFLPVCNALHVSLKASKYTKKQTDKQTNKQTIVISVHCYWVFLSVCSRALFTRKFFITVFQRASPAMHYISIKSKQINRQASKQINKHDICTTECIHASVQVFHQSFPSGSARCSKPWNALLHILQKQGKSQINKKTKTDK